MSNANKWGQINKLILKSEEKNFDQLKKAINIIMGSYIVWILQDIDETDAAAYKVSRRKLYYLFKVIENAIILIMNEKNHWGSQKVLF